MNKPIVALDEDGNDTGLKLKYEEVHGPNSRQDLLCATAHVWIYNSKGEVLLQKRGPDVSTNPNCWDISAAGHIDQGESPEQSALRETKEEIGLDVDKPNLEFITKRYANSHVTNGNWYHEEFAWVYLVKVNVNIDDLVKQKEEVTELRWIDLDKFEAEVHDPKTKVQYVPHDEYYDFIIAEIRKRL